MNDRRLWRVEEDMIIQDLVREHGCKKWTVIAADMSKLCPLFSRTSKQIRERWYNHLDPQINKCPWTEEEERIIFEAHKNYGSKWKQIAKLLHSRTDNSVKNHFYSTLRKSLRRINKYLGFKNSTNQMRVIKPSILSQLINSSQTNLQAKRIKLLRLVLVERIFEFTTFKPSKINKIQTQNLMQSQDKIKYQIALSKLVEFNNNYQKEKKHSWKKEKNTRRMTTNSCHLEENSPISTTIVHPNQDNEPLLHQDQSEIQDSNNVDISNIKNQQESQWSVVSKNNGMLPELQKPEKDYDFLECNQFQQNNKSYWSNQHHKN